MPHNNDQINEILTRGIAEIIPSKKELEKRLLHGEKLSIYLGIDPTGPQLHLGHSVPLLLLRRFQQLGHKTILLIGDFTALIGDPSGRTAERKPLTQEQINNHLKTYKEQASKILDFSGGELSTRIDFNSKWLSKLTFEDLLHLAANFTVGQMIARDMFQGRIKKDLPIGLNEFMYPLAQGYDSVALKVDVEIGASDQLFNMLIGRDLARKMLDKDKFVLTTKLLVNPATGTKMSKSEGSFVALDDSPFDMYGKVMAFPDELIKDCFELCTKVEIREIEEVLKLPPRDAKARLAYTIVEMYHNTNTAEEVAEEFKKVFSKNESPADIPTIQIKEEEKNIVSLLVESNLAPSKNEARRLVEQKGVRIDGKIIDNWERDITIKNGMIVQVGKRRFVKINS